MMRSRWMTEELVILADQAARFLQAELVPERESWERDRCVSRAAWRKAGAAGLLCASIPEEYGGGGGSWAHEAVISCEISRAGLGAGFGLGVSVSCSIVAHYILSYGSEAQKARWLPALATGEIIGAIAMTEPGAGSDLKAIRTQARPCEGGYRITGQKTFITNGQTADLILVVAKTDMAAGAKGMSLLAVEAANAEGFVRGRNLDKLGLHAQDTSELFFEDVFVPEENLLGGEPGRAFAQLMEQLIWERLTVTLNAATDMERAIEMTAAYARERSAFGQRLIDFQNTQFKLAECKASAVVARALFDDMLQRFLEGTLDAATAASAKYWASEALGKVADECLQLFGGYGYMTEYPIARLWADARASRIYAGASDIMKTIIARTL